MWSSSVPDGMKRGFSYNQQHEILQDGLEVTVSRDGDGAIHERAHECPDEAGYVLRPTAHDL